MSADVASHPPVYVEREPVEALRGIVRRLWYLDVTTPGGVERILPIPYVHVIVNLGEPYIVERRGEQRLDRAFDAGFVSGLQSRYLVNHNPERLHHVGAELEPHAWRALGLEPFADDVRPATEVMPALDGVREQALRSPGDPTRALDALETTLTAQVRGPQPDPAVSAMIRHLSEQPGARVADAAAAAGIAASSAASRFRRATGVTAKAHADVIRFHALLAELAQPGPLPTWTELVGRSSYYDQAHFIRAFARFTGYAPREYLRHLGEAGRAAPAFVYPEGD